MDKDKIKEFIFSINGGTGVLFQPSDPNYSYILTAAHVVSDLDMYENLIHINYFNTGTQTFEKFLAFVPEENVNLFMHPDQDIAIIKISRVNSTSEIVLLDNLENNNQNLSLFGFPATRKDMPNPIDRLREDINLTLSTEKSDGLREAVIPDNSTWDELVGQSGGGIITFKNGYVGLLGIQNKVPTRNETKGRIIFSPISNFREIVNTSNGALQALMPNFLSSFSFLEHGIFNMKTGLYSKETVDIIVKVLKEKAKEISSNGCTPVSIREFLKDNLLLLYGQDQDMVFSKKLWTVWLELLTILNVAKAKVHSSKDFNELFSKIRLFYCDTDDDFWLSNLDKLAMSNYGNLESDGLVVVSSNSPAGDDLHVLNFDKIPPNIAETVKRNYEIENIRELQNVPNVNTASDFPLSKYRFINISALKENCVVDKYAEFDINQIPLIITKLKELYEQAISN